MYCRNFTVLSSFFEVKKQRPTMNLEKCYQCGVNIDISLDLKICFSLVTYKINNLLALRSTNQIIAFHFEYKLDHLVLTKHVEKWTNILKKSLIKKKIKKSCRGTPQDFLKYIRPLFIFMHERVNVILFLVLFKNSVFNVGRKWEEIDSITLKKQKLLQHY